MMTRRFWEKIRVLAITVVERMGVARIFQRGGGGGGGVTLCQTEGTRAFAT